MSTDLITKETLIAKGTSGVDRRVIGKGIIALGIILPLLYLALPFLVSIVWNAVSLTIGVAVLGALIMVLKNKTFRRRMGYFLDIFNNALFGWIVSMDPFVIQEDMIEDAEKEAQNMINKRTELEAQLSKTKKEVLEANRQMQQDSKAMQLAMKNNDDDEAQERQNDVIRNKTFVDTMEPMAKDMEFVVEFSKTAHKAIIDNIKEAKKDLQASKRLYESANVSAAVLNSARKAFFGDSEKNEELARARENIKNKIALSVGQMRTSIDLLSKATQSKNYTDKAKFELLKEKMTQINAADQPIINIDQFQTNRAQPIILKDKGNSSATGSSFEDLLK